MMTDKYSGASSLIKEIALNTKKRIKNSIKYLAVLFIIVLFLGEKEEINTLLDTLAKNMEPVFNILIMAIVLLPAAWSLSRITERLSWVITTLNNILEGGLLSISAISAIMIMLTISKHYKESELINGSITETTATLAYIIIISTVFAATLDTCTEKKYPHEDTMIISGLIITFLMYNMAALNPW